MSATQPRITPTELLHAVEMLIDALHCCDVEALEIAGRINREAGLDGVQVLDDAETIIKAAARVVAMEMLEGSVSHGAAGAPKQIEATK